MIWARINGKWRRRIRRCAIVLAALPIAAWLVLQIAVAMVSLPEGLWQTTPVSTVFFDREGRPLREVREGDQPFFEPVELDEVPGHFIDAVLAAEDKRFWRHGGVDWLATARAAGDYASKGRVVSGASTITQQLIKNADPNPRTMSVKLVECLRAIKLERTWPKERILEEYLNRLDYGNLCRGPVMAARYYFDKPMADLSVAESAFLAALPNAPTRLNPTRHFARARERQKTILNRMHANDWLETTAFKRALSEKLVVKKNNRAFEAPHFVDHVRDSAHGGVNQSAIDLPLNRRVKEILNHKLDRLVNRNVSNGAVVVIENNTGNVLAMVGSRDWSDPNAGQVNGALAPRSAGSTFKPFTYCLALENGYTPATVVADVPTEFPTKTGIYRPHNYNRRFHGPVRLRNALANSLNVPAVKVLQMAGGPKVLLDRLRQCGLTTLGRDADFYGLGLTIGNADARLLELANAYACLARLGKYKPPRLLGEDTGPSHQIFDPRAAWLVAHILSDNHARARAFGLGSALEFDFPVACKTGTSTDFRDNWAFGYTPEFTVGVWMGNFDGKAMRGVSGVNGAAPVMREVMLHLRHRFGTGWYTRPKGVVEFKVHPVTGRHDAGGLREWFLDEAPPLVADAGQIIQLGSEYTEWLAGRENWLGGRVKVMEDAVDATRVVSPLPGTVFYIDPELPDSSREISLRLGASGDVSWSSPTLNCVDGRARLVPGRHRLVAKTKSRHWETWILVEEL